MTVMIQKIGNGVPQNGELKRGELGLDLGTNTIYSSSNGTDVVVMGISEIKWEDILGLPDFIINIDPNEPGYIDITELEGRVTVNEEDIAELKGLVIPDSGDSLAELIAQNAANIDTNSQGIAINVGNIDQNKKDIEALELTVDGDGSEGSGLVDKVSDNEESIKDNAEDIAINTEEILKLKNALQGEITGLVLGGTYSAKTNLVTSWTPEGAAAGLEIGQPLISATECKGLYVVVDEEGVLEGTEGVASETSSGGKANGETAYPNDWLVSDGVHGWILFSFHTDATNWGLIGGSIENQGDLISMFNEHIKFTDVIDGGTYTARPSK